MECYDLINRQGIWIAGPASLHIERGSLLATGYIVNEGEDVLIRDRRGATFYSLGKSKVCTKRGEKSKIVIIDKGYQYVEAWMKAVQSLKDTGSKKVVIVGPVESGKSTLAAWIYNTLTLPVIESDIGQNELGVPASITFAYYKGKVVTLQDLQPDGLFFVGHVSADRVESIVISRLFRASRILEGEFVIDTDGYIEGRGIFYKIALIEVVEPDAIIVLGNSRFFRILKSRFASRLLTIFVESPPLVRERTKVDRRVFRQRLYTSLFSRTQTLVLEDTPITNICDFDYSISVIKYNCPTSTIVEAQRPISVTSSSDQHVLPINHIKPKWWKNLLIGLHLGKGTDLVGVVESMRVQEKSTRVAVRIPDRFKVEPSEIRSLTLGWIKLNLPSMIEEHLEPGVYPEVLLRKIRKGRW